MSAKPSESDLGDQDAVVEHEPNQSVVDKIVFRHATSRAVFSMTNLNLHFISEGLPKLKASAVIPILERLTEKVTERGFPASWHHEQHTNVNYFALVIKFDQEDDAEASYEERFAKFAEKQRDSLKTLFVDRAHIKRVEVLFYLRYVCGFADNAEDALTKLVQQKELAEHSNGLIRLRVQPQKTVGRVATQTRPETPPKRHTADPDPRRVAIDRLSWRQAMREGVELKTIVEWVASGRNCNVAEATRIIRHFVDTQYATYDTATGKLFLSDALQAIINQGPEGYKKVRAQVLET